MPGAGFETQTVAERVRRIVSILDCDDYEQVYGLRFDTAIPALIDFQGKTHVYVTATLDGQSRAIKELGHKLDRVHEALERHPSRHDAHLPLTLKVMWEALQQIHPLQSQMRNLESRMQSMEEKQADNTSLRDHIARIEADLNKLREEHSELQRTQHEYEDIQSKWEQMHSTQEQRMSDLERKYTDWARKEIADLRKTFERDLQGRVGNMEKAVERALDVFRADTKRTIDTNTHEDLAVYDTRLEALRMGVTTILRGEMGKSFQSLKTECDSVRRKTQEFTETCVERARRDQEKNFEVALTASREALDKKIDESIEVNKREALLAEGRPEGRAEGKLSGGWEVLRKEMEHHRTMSEEELGRCKREVLSLIQRVDKTTGDTEARMKAVEQSLETLEGTMDTLTARVENQVTMLVQQCTLIEGKNDELDRTLDLQAQVSEDIQLSLTNLKQSMDRARTDEHLAGREERHPSKRPRLAYGDPSHRPQLGQDSDNIEDSQSNTLRNRRGHRTETTDHESEEPIFDRPNPNNQSSQYEIKALLANGQDVPLESLDPLPIPEASLRDNIHKYLNNAKPSPNAKYDGRCLCHHLSQRKQTVWSNDFGKNAACRACTNKRRPCLRIVNQASYLLLPLLPELRGNARPTDNSYWVREFDGEPHTPSTLWNVGK